MRFPCALAVAGALACAPDDASGPSEDGTLTVRVAAPATPLEAVRARIGGTDSAEVVLVSEGDGFLSGSVPQLAPGRYGVRVRGLVDGDVDHFGRTDNVLVRAGEHTNVLVPFPTFVPVLDSLPTATTNTALRIAFPLVAAADSYLVELAADAEFGDATRRTFAAPGLAIAATDTGQWHVRARAAGVPGLGRWSATRRTRLVPEAAGTGDDQATAADLGFATQAGGTREGFNILPAGDEDWFAIRLCRDDFLQVVLTTVAGGAATPLRPIVEVFDPAGVAVSASDGGPAPTVRALVPGPGTYAVRVRGADGTVGAYGLTVTVATGPETGASDCLPAPLTANERISAGMVHSCAVASDGTAHCWGDNAFGQLGDGSRQGRGNPVAVAGGLVFRTVSAGWEHTCGVTTTHEAWCWGRNDDGQLGDGSVAGTLTPVRVQGDRRFREVSAGVAHTCGVTIDGTVLCWGANADGRLGDGSNTPRRTPAAIADEQVYRSVSAGFRHTCAVTTTASALCWGDDGWGQLGNGSGVGSSATPVRIGLAAAVRQVSVGFEHSCAVDPDGRAWCWGFNRIAQHGTGQTYVINQLPVAVDTDTRFRSIAVSFGADTTGGAHTCGLATDGTAWCWGLNITGQVGTQTAETCDKPDIIDVKQFPCATRPVPVQGGLTFLAVTSGLTHSCGITTAGDAVCWGDNQVGQGGDGSAPTTTPTLVAGGLDIVEIHPSKFHTCALAADRSAWCWGANAHGQLGNGTTDRQTTPSAVNGGLAFATFTAGQDHTCGTTADGAAWCWGKGLEGQLGIGGQGSVLTPTAVAGGLAFQKVSAGDRHTCGVTADSLAYCWGNGAEGRTGTNQPGIAETPAAVAGGHRFVTINAGNIHACAAKGSGALYCWGYNSDGQIGNGAGATDDFSAVPDSVLTTQDFLEVSTGFYHTCGVTAADDIWCWGDNASGQLGDGTLEDQRVPTHVADQLDFAAVSAGFYHSCGLTPAGEAWCWGDNLWGQLGNGETTDRSVPVRVAGGLTFDKLFSGDHHTCGITASGETYCWGRNCRGQLGIGRDGMTYTPLTVAGGLRFDPPVP